MDRRTVVVLSFVQLFFTLSWTVYVVYLPALLARVGLAGQAPWILVADQLVFVASDLFVGAALDRAKVTVARLAPTFAVMVVISALAFALAPVAASKVGLLASVFVWVLTSSALRVPPMVLLARYAGPRAGTRAAVAYGAGIGVAGAAAPYVQLALRDRSPLLPFALASSGVVLASFALAGALRRAAGDAPRDAASDHAPAEKATAARTLLVALGLGALAFQVHFSLRAAPGFARIAGPAALAKLMPVFWVGFNLALVPATTVLAKWPARSVLVASGVLGAVTASLFEATTSLPIAIGCQLVAGAAWAALFFGGLGGAASLGATGREGRLVGRFFALLAGAALLRIAFVGAGLDKAGAALLPAIPPIAWAGVAIALLLGDLHALDRRGAG